MSRPKAGNAWTSFTNNGKRIDLIRNDAGRWITTGEACHWRRCPRCRRPFENDPFDCALCPICYFYETGLSITEFWRLHDEGYYLAPYNIGGRETRLDVTELRAGNWRKALQKQKVVD